MNTTANRTEPSRHVVHLEHRRHASITGVLDVCSFHETEIVLKIDSGVLVLSGSNLHIGKLLVQEGHLDVEGQIDGVVYEGPGCALRKKWPWRRTEE